MAYCLEVKLPDGGVALVRMAGKRPANCRWCSSLHTKLCDFVVSSPQVVTHKKTCDAPMCDAHAKNVGPDKDYCPEHAEAS